MEQVEQLIACLRSSPVASEPLLYQWNDNVEDMLFGPVETQLQSLPSAVTEEEFQKLQVVSRELRRYLFKVLLPEESADYDKDDVHSQVDRVLAKTAIKETSSTDPNALASSSQLLQTIRALRNWLRFYLQIDPVLETSRLDATSLVKVFQENDMLRLYLHMVESYSHQLASPSDNKHNDIARYAAQILFYATLHPVPTTTSAEQISCLMNELHLPRRILRLYATIDSIDLALALTQNVHNLLASSSPATARVVAEMHIQVPDDATSPWIVPSDTSPDNTALTFRTVWNSMLDHCLCKSEPSFPGKTDDYRAELVVEILRSLYAMRIRSMTPTEQRLVPVLLALDEKEDPRCAECHRSIMSLLTEADPSMGTTLAESSMPDLLRILEAQVNAVVSASRVDNAAAAALTPVLVTFYRFCQGNPVFLQSTREVVFPNALSDEAISTMNGQQQQKMTPEDAPEGTVRWKLVRLLTWPQSHIKRFAAEILWLLSGSNPKEFSRRVGVGNALPFLAAKGHAQLPSGVFQ